MHFLIEILRRFVSPPSCLLKGCEKMGLAPGPRLENAKENGLSRVPVPIFSQPRLKKGSCPFCAKHPQGRSGKRGMPPFSARIPLPAAIAVTLGLWLNVCHAGSPRVQFDVAAMVGCRDVTPAEFAEVNPHERLFEARFQVSSLIRGGDEDGLAQYLYRIESPHGGFFVVDYLPKTTLATDVVGPVGIQNEREKTQSVGINVSGHYDNLVRGDASATRGTSIKSNVRYELLPPLELLASSGTIGREGGVYYKLRPSKRTSLEGAREFTIVLRVPHAWRGDFVRVRCEAAGRRTGILPTFENQGAWGMAEFLVALYAEGDGQAKRAAAQLVYSEQALRETVGRCRREIRRLAYPDISIKLGKTPKFVGPKLSAGWIERFLSNPERTEAGDVYQHLPQEVRDALTRCSDAKGTLRRLNGRETILAQMTSSAE